jgi:ABC-type branched-subunit amino acid transport system ATPase component
MPLKEKTTKVTLSRKGTTRSYKIERLTGAAVIDVLNDDDPNKPRTEELQVGDAVSLEQAKALCERPDLEVTCTQ